MTVTYDVVSDASLSCVGMDGQLAFQPNVNTRMRVGTLMVRPGGALQIGSESSPISAGVVAEVIIASDAPNTAVDPHQFGTGLIGLGRVTMHGAPKTPTFVRLAQEASAGQGSLQLGQAATGWRASDRVIIPDSRHLRQNDLQGANPISPQWEERLVSSVAGTQLALNSGLSFNHPGARDGNGALTFLPHVGNLTRNVVIRSDDLNGVRGHVIVTHRANVDIRYALFKDLGRTTLQPLDSTTVNAQGAVTHVGTNQIGRYALHVHHVFGPTTPPANGYQFTLIGNAVDGGRRWGITIHNSHYGLIRDNVIYKTGGAGVMTEDGNESFNVIERNFVVRMSGSGDAITTRAGTNEYGHEGTHFWLRGPNNYVRDNVGANGPDFGYTFYHTTISQPNRPAFQGADPSQPGQGVATDWYVFPLLEFARNEAYGALPGGLTTWDVGAEGYERVGTATNLVKDLRIWHVHAHGFYSYHTSHLTFDGTIIRGDRNVLVANPGEFGLGMWWADYTTHRTVVRNADIQGMKVGIVVPYLPDRLSSNGTDAGLYTIENSYLRNSVGISVGTLFNTLSAADSPPRKGIIRNVRFDTLPGVSGPQHSILMDYSVQPISNLVKRDQVLVYDYNGVAGQHFQVFFREQRADFVVPASSGSMVGAPVAGLTNAQTWATYGIAIGGAVAPCSQTRSEIQGFVCPVGAPPPPTNAPAAPTGVRIIR